MRVIIVGCGRMGSELANSLWHDGHDVTVVDKDPRAFYRLGAAFKGATIEGIGFDRDVLIRAGVERADALAATTSGDNSNVITARVARNVFRVPKVIARLYDPRRADIYQRLGLQTVSSTAWGVSRASTERRSSEQRSRRTSPSRSRPSRSPVTVAGVTPMRPASSPGARVRPGQRSSCMRTRMRPSEVLCRASCMSATVRMSPASSLKRRRA
jgi:hypothetical protein